MYYLEDFSPDKYPNVPPIIAVITGIIFDVNSFPFSASNIYMTPIDKMQIANIIVIAEIIIVLFLLSPIALICAADLGFIASNLSSIIFSKAFQAASSCKVDEDDMLAEEPRAELVDEKGFILAIYKIPSIEFAPSSFIFLVRISISKSLLIGISLGMLFISFWMKTPSEEIERVSI